MKQLYLFLLLLFPMSVAAQETIVEKYDYAPHNYQNVFLDYVADNPCKTITTTSGQYVGQVDEDNLLCGYGMFINNDGSQIIGQFNKGKLLFGITMASDYARVGDADFYANYSLSTGRLEYISNVSNKHVIDGKELYDYGFVSMRYQNGDQYVGELYKHQRHGFGIYYYANGNVWFGEYNNDVRSGFGALFDRNNHLSLGWWEGEDLRRVIQVKSKK